MLCRKHICRKAKIMNMKILWVSSSPIGPASTILGKEYEGSSGGWIQSEYEFLDRSNAEMSFLCFFPNVPKASYRHLRGDAGDLYLIKTPKMQYGVEHDRVIESQVSAIIDTIQPDIIQIWGTETCLSYFVSQCRPDIPKVIFIQGLLGVHVRYRGGYFTKKANSAYYVPRSLPAYARSRMKKKMFETQVEIERRTIRNAKHVIIDSDFAEAYCRSLGDNICCFYHVLKPNRVFDQYRWSLQDAESHRIFTVYASSAEKGVQQLLRAVALLMPKYPDIKVMIPGPYRIDEKGRLVPRKGGGFEATLQKMIHHFGMEANVCFTGRLNATEMAEQISRAHIFVNPSCMEVHGLSLREAMSMGVPCISSLCGSTGSYVKHGENGMIYRYEEHEVLALYIDHLFSNETLCQQLSIEAMRVKDEFQKDQTKPLRDIYIDIMSKRA